MRLQVNLTPDWQLDVEMREFPPTEDVDVCIIGTGAGGGVLAQRLARSGFSVVCLEAGPWHDSETGMVSDEAGSRPLYWNQLRITGGTEPLMLGANNSGRGVGGGTVHYAAFCPRLHPSDFMVRSLDGVADDWPIRYEELEPYYRAMEQEYPVAGPSPFPWGKRHDYPYAPLQSGTAGHVLIRGCLELGIPVCAGGPVGINAGTFGKRPHCVFRGFCLQGCKVGAKASTMVNHLPAAIGDGAEIRANCMAYELPVDRAGRVTGVRYFRQVGEGRIVDEEQRARVVIVAGYAIETPRLLLNSTSSQFPNGLANSSGLVGKRLMAQAGQVVWGRFREMIRQYKAPPACAETEEFYETDARNDFARGYSIQSVSPLPIAMAHLIGENTRAFGWSLRHLMEEYNHYAAIGVLGEILPDDRNYVSIADEKDDYGIPVADVHFNLFDNDKKLITAAVRRCTQVLEAAGALETHHVNRYAHLVGTCRMGDDPRTSVTDKFGRCWDVPNLFLGDSSVFVTQGSANPALTISALAARQADHLRQLGVRHELTKRAGEGRAP